MQNEAELLLKKNHSLSWSPQTRNIANPAQPTLPSTRSAQTQATGWPSGLSRGKAEVPAAKPDQAVLALVASLPPSLNEAMKLH